METSITRRCIIRKSDLREPRNDGLNIHIILKKKKKKKKETSNFKFKISYKSSSIDLKNYFHKKKKKQKLPLIPLKSSFKKKPRILLHASKKKGFASSFSPKNRDITGKIRESHYYTLYIYRGARNYIHRVHSIPFPKGNRLAGGGFKSSSPSPSFSSRSGRCKNPKPGASLARLYVNHVRPEARVRPALPLPRPTYRPY